MSIYELLFIPLRFLSGPAAATFTNESGQLKDAVAHAFAAHLQRDLNVSIKASLYPLRSPRFKTVFLQEAVGLSEMIANGIAELARCMKELPIPSNRTPETLKNEIIRNIKRDPSDLFDGDSDMALIAQTILGRVEKPLSKKAKEPSPPLREIAELYSVEQLHAAKLAIKSRDIESRFFIPLIFLVPATLPLEQFGLSVADAVLGGENLFLLEGEKLAVVSAIGLKQCIPRLQDKALPNIRWFVQDRHFYDSLLSKKQEIIAEQESDLRDRYARAQFLASSFARLKIMQLHCESVLEFGPSATGVLLLCESFKDTPENRLHRAFSEMLAVELFKEKGKERLFISVGINEV